MNPEIRQLIKAENLLRIFSTAKNGGTFLRIVDYVHGAPVEDRYGGRYQIYLSSEMPKQRDEVVCLFPNHKTSGRPIVHASSYMYLTSFNKAINAALENSSEETAVGMRIKFAVAYGDQVYTCKDMTGPVYIIWATHVNRINVGNVANTIGIMVPLIVNTDGLYRIKSIFMLKQTALHVSDLELLPRAKGNPKILFPKKPIFVCESRPVDPPGLVVKTVSERDALSVITAETKNTRRWLKSEANVFEAPGTEEPIQYSGGAQSSLRIEGLSDDDDDDDVDEIELAMPVASFMMDTGPDPFAED